MPFRKLSLAPIIGGCMLFFACGSNNQQQTDINALTKAEGVRYYGGVFNFNETEYFRSLYPHNVTEVVGHRITNQIYEGLITLNQADLSIEPSLAESYAVNENATEFSFKIRENVRFHDDPCFDGGKGRIIKAQDFVYCLTKLCKPDPNNQGFWIFKDVVKGANEYYYSRVYFDLKERYEKLAENASSNQEELNNTKLKMDEITDILGEEPTKIPETVEGLELVDDYNLKIILERPFASFMYRLAMPFAELFPQEAFDKYGVKMREHCVGTGPFKVKKLVSDEVILLTRNEDYWGEDELGNQLPYLNGVKVNFIKEEKVAFLEFKSGKLDAKYRLPLELVNEILDDKGGLKPDYQKFQLQESVELSTQYYGYLQTSEYFSNVDLRKAFNYAINREEIVEYTVKGQGNPAIYGFVPMGMYGYDNTSVKGYSFDIEKARAHLAKAGYPNGEGLETITLQINSGGGRNEQVAEAVQKMLEENLNIQVNITQLPFAQHLENIETSKVQFWRAGWIADYPDPENFLNLCFGEHVPAKETEKSYLNTFRYKNANYDALYTQAMETIDDQKRNELYAQLDQMIMDDAVMMPIYYTKAYRLLQPNVRNYPQNAMEYRNFRAVYFVP